MRDYNHGHGCKSHQLHIYSKPFKHGRGFTHRRLQKRIRRRYRPRKPQKEVIQRLRTNAQIKAPRILIIDESGQNLGEMSAQEALEIAKSRGLDLVEVYPKAVPPVCKITDHGKLQYQRTKQYRQNQSKQKKGGTKGVRLGMRTDVHDLTFKKNQTEKFLKKGNKVKIEMRLRGREKAHQDMAREVIKKFIEELEIPTKTEEEIKRSPQGFHTIIAPE
ncbi:MAG: translation initiation factor IF-3 [Candidatus Moranbacteria bacterium]|nr:translation initiation factor IF-3 [Candidatus Moranbacteria bacterium]